MLENCTVYQKVSTLKTLSFWTVNSELAGEGKIREMKKTRYLQFLQDHLEIHSLSVRFPKLVPIVLVQRPHLLSFLSTSPPSAPIQNFFR